MSAYAPDGVIDGLCVKCAREELIDLNTGLCYDCSNEVDEL